MGDDDAVFDPIVQTSIRVPRSTLDRLDDVGRRWTVGRNWLIARLLREGVDNLPTDLALTRDRSSTRSTVRRPDPDLDAGFERPATVDDLAYFVAVQREHPPTGVGAEGALWHLCALVDSMMSGTTVERPVWPTTTPAVCAPGALDDVGVGGTDPGSTRADREVEVRRRWRWGRGRRGSTCDPDRV